MTLNAVLIRKNAESSFYEVWGGVLPQSPHLFSKEKVIELASRLKAQGYKVWGPKDILKEVRENGKQDSQVS